MFQRFLVHGFYFLFIFCGSFHETCLGKAPEIIPHRGGRAEMPENTLQAFDECIKLGAKTLELDVQLTKDNVVVVYHPNDLSANTDGTGIVAGRTCSELQSLDAAYKFQESLGFPYRGKGYIVPKLSDVLEKYPTTRLIVDLKSIPAEPLVKAVADVVDSQKAWGRVIFYSTHDEHLEILKKNYPQAQFFQSRALTVHTLLSSDASTWIPETCDTIFIGFELVREVTVEEKLALGVARYAIKLPCWSELAKKRLEARYPNAYVVMFGINTKEDYEKAAVLEADAVYTDSPKLLSESFKN